MRDKTVVVKKKIIKRKRSEFVIITLATYCDAESYRKACKLKRGAASGGVSATASSPSAFVAPVTAALSCSASVTAALSRFRKRMAAACDSRKMRR
jgi:hypothetical protein